MGLPREAITNAGRFRDGHYLTCILAICKEKPGVPNAPGFFFARSSQRRPIIIARHWAAVGGLRRASTAPFSPAIGWTEKHSPPD